MVSSRPERTRSTSFGPASSFSFAIGASGFPIPLSIASMIFGALAAIGQKNLKRLVAYSSIGHMGFALAGLSSGTNEGIQSSIIYISIYLIMNLGLFSCLFMMKRNDKYYENIDDLSGLSKNHPLISLF